MHDELQRPDRHEHGPLAGFTVGVTAARRADELGALLQRRGAAVLHAPALRIVPLSDDSELLAATKELIDQAPDVVVATTAIGFRGWIEAADGWGLGEALLDRLRGVELLARGPKVKGAVRAQGLTEEWSPSSESMAEVLDRLLEEGVDGRRIAIQLHGEPLPGFVEALRDSGAEVVGVPVYRWMPPEDIAPVDRLLDATVSRGLDALTFTSAPHGPPRCWGAPRIAGCCPSCSPPLTMTYSRPASGRSPRCRCRRGASTPSSRSASGSAPSYSCCVRNCLRGRVRCRSRGIGWRFAGMRCWWTGSCGPYHAAGMSLLRALSRRPGWVVSRAELLRALPGAGRDEHAVETAMARLRTALGAPKLIQTVVKRGYRLALDPAADSKYADV